MLKADPFLGSNISPELSVCTLPEGRRNDGRINKQTDRQADWQAEREIGRQAHRQADGRTDNKQVIRKAHFNLLFRGAGNVHFM